MRNIKKIMLSIITLTITTVFLVGCNKEGEIEKVLNDFTKTLNERDFETAYESISNESKESIDKETFLTRYYNIYTAMDAKNIEIDIKEVDNENISTSISIDTIAGNLKYEDVSINVIKEDKDYKLLWDENLIIPGMQKDDKVRVKTSEAKRGSILDKDDNILAKDDYVNSINIHPEVFYQDEENVGKVSDILDISESYIEDTLEGKPEDQLIYLLDVSPYEKDKVEKLTKIDGVSTEEKMSRVYKNSEAFGSLIGHIGNVNAEDLEANDDYTQYDKIGRAGIELVYEEKLRAKDGVYIYLERNGEEVEVAKTEPKDGEDIKLSIDSKLQEKVYKEMKNDKGASVAVDPKSGDVLAMVSSPSYNSNTKVTYTTREIAEKWEKQDNAQATTNANNAYSPGSTMKLLTSAIGLEKGTIDPNEKINIVGKDWQKDDSWGDYHVSRVKDTKEDINLYDAVKYSDNIYFAQMATKIGEKDYIEGLKKFGVGEEIKFDYPMDKSQISNDGTLEKEVLLADTGYGQGEVLMTPLDVALSYTALVNDGNIMTPRLVINEYIEASIYKEAIDKNYIGVLKEAFKGAIDDKEGTGHLAKIEGQDILGKTGTAEIKDSKDDEDGTENGWFVAVNDNDPKISISMIIEDVDTSTSEYVVPKVKNILEYYLK